MGQGDNLQVVQMEGKQEPLVCFAPLLPEEPVAAAQLLPFLVAAIWADNAYARTRADPLPASRNIFGNPNPNRAKLLGTSTDCPTEDKPET